MPYEKKPGRNGPPRIDRWAATARQKKSTISRARLSARSSSQPYFGLLPANMTRVFSSQRKLSSNMRIIRVIESCRVSNTKCLIAASESTVVPRPRPLIDEKLYCAPPAVASRAFSTQPVSVAET